MLGKQAVKRLWHSLRPTEDSRTLTKYGKDIKLVCMALEIYRDLGASQLWRGTGDETPHAEYLKTMDIYAKRAWRIRNNA